MEEVVLGVDLGTSSVKIIVVNTKGEIVASVSHELELIQEQSGYNEQDPIKWYEAICSSMKTMIHSGKLNNCEVKGMSFSGQMHGLVLLDEHLKPLRNAILWNDTRNSEQCEKLKNMFGERLNGNPILEGFTLPKILWVQQHEPDVWDKVKYFMLPKDYVRFRLTGEIHMEYSDAAGTLLLDPKTNEWDKKLGQQLNIDDIFPNLVDSSECVGDIEAAVAKELGLKNDVKVFAGGADNACGAIGAGVVRVNDTLCSIGTSGVILNVETEQYKKYDQNIHFFKHAIPQSSYAMGVMLAAGYSLNWLKDQFFENESFETIISYAESSQIGANQLLFAPYLTGERTPHGDAFIRGSFIGVSGHQSKADFARAVIEGITYALNDSIRLIRASGKNVNSITSIGGGAKSDFWLQLQADVFNAEIRKLEHEEGPSMGAAIIAAFGLGWFESIEACTNKWIKISQVFTPNLKSYEQYEKYYQVYQMIYSQTQPITEALLKLND